MKITNLLIGIATVAMLITSCKRQELENQPQPAAKFTRKTLVIGDSIRQENCANYSFLKFKNKEVFLNTMIFLSDNSMYSDSIFDDFENAFSYTPLRDAIEALPNDSLKLVEYGKITQVLASVVSQDSIVQIDSLAFLFDFENEHIYEMYPVTCSNLSVLKMKQEVNNDSMYVMRYNFYDPVFHPTGYEQYSGKMFRWLRKVFGGCDEIWASTPLDPKSEPYGTIINSPFIERFSYSTRHMYRHYAVYFETKREWRHYKGDLTRGTPFAVPVAFSHQDGWKQYCGSWGSSANWPNSTFGLNAYFDFKTYQSTNSLSRDKNLMKSYLWFIPQGNPLFPFTSPKSVTLKDLNF